MDISNHPEESFCGPLQVMCASGKDPLRNISHIDRHPFMN